MNATTTDLDRASTLTLSALTGTLDCIRAGRLGTRSGDRAALRSIRKAWAQHVRACAILGLPVASGVAT